MNGQKESGCTRFSLCHLVVTPDLYLYDKSSEFTLEALRQNAKFIEDHRPIDEMLV